MANDPAEREKGPYANEIGEALYRRRTEEYPRGTPVAELARRIGIERRDMSWIVNGHRLPSAEMLDAICEVLGWTWKQLYPRKEFRDAIEATRKAAV